MNETQGKATAVIMGKNPDGENIFLQTDENGHLKTTVEVTVALNTREDQ